MDPHALAAEPAEPFYRRFGWLAVRVVATLTRQRWSGTEHVPPAEGVLVVANHISNFDPLELGHYLISGAGRWPRFIGKSDIWRVPAIGWLARNCGQIPVRRNGPQAKDVIDVADAAIRAGKCVCIYPEGTITADPEEWPMHPRTGAARIALATGCPVIPVGMWGAQAVMPGKRLTWPRLYPRHTMTVIAGPPVALDDLRDRELSHEVLVEAGQRIMAAITALVERARGEQAPAERFDLRRGARGPLA